MLSSQLGMKQNVSNSSHLYLSRVECENMLRAIFKWRQIAGSRLACVARVNVMNDGKTPTRWKTHTLHCMDRSSHITKWSNRYAWFGQIITLIDSWPYLQHLRWKLGHLLLQHDFRMAIFSTLAHIWWYSANAATKCLFSDFFVF